MNQNLKESLLEFIRRTSSEMPKDLADSIFAATKREETGSRARYAMDIICQNIGLAKEKSQPICQDTGTILFFIKCPVGTNQLEIEEAAKWAVAEATAKGYLRQNSVDSLTGKNSGNNLGPGSPSFHFEQIIPPNPPLKKGGVQSSSPPLERGGVQSSSPPLERGGVQSSSPPLEKGGEGGFEVRLILKGGGCENCGAQYSLPNKQLDAQRDLDGVRKCILDCVVQAQGKGCGPGILGVCVGGDRPNSYLHSKEQLLRPLDDKSNIPVLAKMEDEVMEISNKLGIGPMGFGGKTTLLGCKISALNRLPASFFVSVSYMCWADRRQGIVLDRENKIEKWLY